MFSFTTADKNNGESREYSFATVDKMSKSRYRVFSFARGIKWTDTGLVKFGVCVFVTGVTATLHPKWASVIVVTTFETVTLPIVTCQGDRHSIYTVVFTKSV